MDAHVALGSETVMGSNADSDRQTMEVPGLRLPWVIDAQVVLGSETDVMGSDADSYRQPMEVPGLKLP